MSLIQAKLRDCETETHHGLTFQERWKCPLMGGQEDKGLALFHHGLRRRLLRILRDAHSQDVTFFVILNKRIVTGYLHLPWSGLVYFQPEDVLKWKGHGVDHPGCPLFTISKDNVRAK